MRRMIVLPVLVAALALGACGSDSKTDSSTGTTVAAGGTGSDDATTSSTGATATTEASGSGGGGAAGLAEVCAGRAAAAPPAQGAAVDYSQYEDNLAQALEHAPSEIKPDMTTVFTPLIEYFKILKDSNGNFASAAQNARFLALSQDFSKADYQAAAQRIQAWFTEHCR